MEQVKGVYNSAVDVVSPYLPAPKKKTGVDLEGMIDRVAEVWNEVEWLVFLDRRGGTYLRIAGASGALAVILGAYGAHTLKKQTDIAESRITAFETGNRFHLIHSAALLATPLVRRPYLVGGLLTGGTLIFCGSCYAHGLTGNDKIRKLAPVGGALLIAGWIAMLL